jgi:hypothetical protein
MKLTYGNGNKEQRNTKKKEGNNTRLQVSKLKKFVLKLLCSNHLKLYVSFINWWKLGGNWM